MLIKMKTEADYLFEISWEVCNKVGGIYTVVKSKAIEIMEYYKENYFAIGPFFPEKVAGEFQEKVPPDKLAKAFEKLDKEGIKCHYGNWLIKGEPNTILVDFSGFTSKKDEIKTSLWQNFKIDSLNTKYFDFDEPVIWSYAVGKLLEEIKNVFKDKKIVAQFHEWLAGAGLLYLKQNNIKVATVFTTHATILGRTMSFANEELYEIFDKINPEERAYNYRIQAKFLTEKQSALNADLFTTVSEITAIEAEHLLGKKPDMLLPNGLDLKKFPTFEEASIKHRLYRERIKEFLMYYFFPYYSFDLDNTLLYFLCGRYEFRAKGIDIFIKALARLNEKLKKEKSNKTIVAFFWIPGNIRAIKTELLENKTFFEDIKDAIDDNLGEIKNRVIYSIVSKKSITEKNIFDEDFLHENKKKVLKLMKKGDPELTTHDLQDEQNDSIIKALNEAGLLNKKEDRVKVVFYPIYLTGADRLLDLGYYECMQGSHLGVFPSYYEPWGYTPLEAAALGVSSVTTDLAGFGRYVNEKSAQSKNPGIFVLKRLGKKDEEVVEELANALYYFSSLSKQERIKNKMEAQRLAALADWEVLIKNYIEAYNLAVKKGG